MALLDDPHKSHIVFGTCNMNFTQYRRLRFWDEKVRLGILVSKQIHSFILFQRGVLRVAYPQTAPPTPCPTGSSPTPSRTRSIKWGKAFKNVKGQRQG